MTVVEPASGSIAQLGQARSAVTGSTTAERAANAVREEVVEGRLRPGTRLPDTELAEALGVSRNTMREAMSQLVTERVLVRHPNRGVYVATPEVDDVRDVYRARRLIERAALRWGQDLDAVRLAALRAAVTEGQEAVAAGDWTGVASANQHFHRALVGLAGSPRLEQQMALLLAEMRLIFHRMPGVREFHEPFVGGNDGICSLLEAGDREGAERALMDYFDEAEAQLLESYARL
ncbi:GntR family transcriptional regulator [Pseudonocardia sp. CA-107938]|uniref:GntR family transcriptional regulator n=1 Tax=Pseudonocardia sp. CA-107938 TaxID=3240021 RepID=UPI003D8B1D7F